jgi:hypothetical protein
MVRLVDQNKESFTTHNSGSDSVHTSLLNRLWAHRFRTKLAKTKYSTTMTDVRTIEKFNGENYKDWKWMVELILAEKGVLGHVHGTVPCPEDGEEKVAWHRRDQKARAILCLAIESKFHNLLRECTTSKTVLDTMDAKFKTQSLGTIIGLRRKFFNLKASEGTDMIEFINSVKRTADLLRETDAKVTNFDIVLQILSGLPDSYLPLITALGNYTKDQLTVDLVINRVLQEESIRKDRSTQPSALYAAGNFNNKNKGHKQKGNHKKNFSPSNKSNNNNGDKRNTNNSTLSVPRCKFCGRRGHTEEKCKKKVEALKQLAQEYASPGQANTAQTNVNEYLLTTTTHTTSFNNCWIVDSGATSHMTAQVSTLTSKQNISPIPIRLGNDHVVNATAAGTVKLRMLDDSKQTCDISIADVLLVPDISKNLLSVHSICKKGASVTFTSDTVQINTSDGHTIAKGHVQDGLYVLPSTTNFTNHCNLATTKDDLITLWHRRLGHINSQRLARIASFSESGVNLQSQSQLPFCEACTLGKMHTIKVSKSAKTRASALLERVHSDICGPMSTPSLNNSKYFTTFIDDFSRYTEVAFLKSKDEYYDKLAQFLETSANLKGQRVKFLRLDNAGENKSDRVRTLLANKGIKLEEIAPYTPQHNGVAERKNRTLVEMARCLLQQAGLSKRFWAEAVNTANFITNRVPTSALSGKIPTELWTGVKHSLKDLRVFGCQAYALDPNPHTKFDPRSKPLIYIGPMNEGHAYKLWNPLTRRVSVSRNVAFNESAPAKDVCNAPSTVVNFVVNNLDDLDYPSPPPLPTPPLGIDTVNELDISQIPPSSPEALPVSPTIDGNPSSIQASGLLPVSESPAPPSPPVEQPTNQSSTSKPKSRKDIPLRPPSTRNIKPRKIFDPSALVAQAESFPTEPESYKEALASPDAQLWLQAMKEEYNSLRLNDTWTLVRLPRGARLVDSRWVYRLKYNPDGTIARHKARFVAKGYSQRDGIDYHEIFSPVARYTSIRAVLAFAAANRIMLHQMDVDTAFLYGKVDEAIYVRQPEGFVDPSNPNLVCKLNKALYGIKQASRCWFIVIRDFLNKQGFTASVADPCIFIRRHNGKLDIIALYVDDLLIGCSDDDTLAELKSNLHTQFRMKDLGTAKYILGMEITHHPDGSITLSQGAYICDVLREFAMEEANPSTTPLPPGIKLCKRDGTPSDSIPYRRLVGRLMYASTGCRPDITFAVSYLSRFLNCYSEAHYNAAKYVLRYLAGTSNLGLKFKGGQPLLLTGYSDSDWGGDTNDRKSTSGYAFLVTGSSTISWASKKQQTVALSSTEAEYMALSDACKEAIWLRQLLLDLGHPQIQATPILVDNRGSIELTKHPVFHARTKHIDIRYHFIREKVEDNTINIMHCPTLEMVADFLTKPLSTEKFKMCRSAMMHHSVSKRGC